MSNDSDGYSEFGDDSPGLPALIRDPIGVVQRQYRWMLATALLTLIAAVVVIALTPLRYQARATILMTAKSIPDEYVPTTIIASIAEQFGAIRSEVFSRDHLSKMIAETGIYADQHGIATNSELVERLRKNLVAEPIGGGRRSRYPSSALAIEVVMTGEDPQTVARIVNTTIAHLINENIEYRGRQAGLTTSFMQREFDRSDAALRDHQRQLAEFREKHRGALPEERTTAISTLNRLEEQRRSAILQLSDYQARLENFDARPEIMSSGEDLNSMRARLQHARTIYTDDHPSVHSLQRQIESMESTEGSNGATHETRRTDERAKIQDGVESTQLRLSQIDREVARLETLLAQTPQIAEEYAALVRLEKILQENYVEYLRKVKSSELALSLESAQQGAQLTRIDAAVAPTDPVNGRWKLASAGFVAAMGLAVLVAIGRELLNPVIIDEKHLEDTLPVPLLGSIARIT